MQASQGHQAHRYVKLDFTGQLPSNNPIPVGLNQVLSVFSWVRAYVDATVARLRNTTVALDTTECTSIL